MIAGALPDPFTYYREHVVQGPGDFVELAQGYDDYPAAILRKLLREIGEPWTIGARH